MSKLILHIGSHKTGTSSIQRYFAARRETHIKDYGLLYPISGRGKGQKGHHLFPWLLNGKHGVSDSGSWKELENECSAIEHRIVLISSEEFCNLSIPQLRILRKKVSQFDELLVIGFLRRPDSYLVASYKEFIKSKKAYTGRFQDFAGDRITSIDYEEICSRWMTVFGPKVLRFKSYEKVCREDGLLEYMSQLVGIEFGENESFRKLHNISPSDNTSCLLLAINRRLRKKNRTGLEISILSWLKGFIRKYDLGRFLPAQAVLGELVDMAFLLELVESISERPRPCLKTVTSESDLRFIYGPDESPPC